MMRKVIEEYKSRRGVIAGFTGAAEDESPSGSDAVILRLPPGAFHLAPGEYTEGDVPRVSASNIGAT